MGRDNNRQDFEGWSAIKKFPAGFTLLEILAVLGVLAIVAALTFPAFSNWIPVHRLKLAAQDLYGNFQLAKASAVDRGQNCSISFYQPIDQETYDYVVFIDSDANLEYDPGEKVLVRRMWGARQFLGISFDKSRGHGDGLTFSKNDDGLPAISFQPSGIPVSNSGGLGMGTAYLINKKGKTAKIIVSCSGNIRVE